MEEQLDSNLLFVELIMEKREYALIALGRAKHPATGQYEKNLELAKLTIDILDMLKVKTAGNVNEDESRLLEGVITDLKMNYEEQAAEDNSTDEA